MTKPTVKVQEKDNHRGRFGAGLTPQKDRVARAQDGSTRVGDKFSTTDSRDEDPRVKNPADSVPCLTGQGRKRLHKEAAEQWSSLDPNKSRNPGPGRKKLASLGREQVKKTPPTVKAALRRGGVR